jgi:tetratricopeptide (TPR) repeat protein
MPRRRITWRRLRRWLRSGPTADPAELLGLDGEASEELAYHAHRLLNEGEPAQAERVYLLTVTLWPTRAAPAWLGMGVCRQALGDLDRAEQAYGKCLEMEPGNIHASANRAEVRLQLGQRELAAVDLAASRVALDREGASEELRGRIGRLCELCFGAAGPLHPIRIDLPTDSTAGPT